MSDFISELERELRAASTRRVRLTAARVPRPSNTTVVLALSILVCLVVAGAFLAGHRGPPASRAGSPTTNATPPPTSVHNPVITDCVKHGTLTGHYTRAQLRHALKVMPAADRQYTNCARTIKSALPPRAK